MKKEANISTVKLFSALSRVEGSVVCPTKEFVASSIPVQFSSKHFTSKFSTFQFSIKPFHTSLIAFQASILVLLSAFSPFQSSSRHFESSPEAWTASTMCVDNGLLGLTTPPEKWAASKQVMTSTTIQWAASTDYLDRHQVPVTTSTIPFTNSMNHRAASSEPIPSLILAWTEKEMQILTLSTQFLNLSKLMLKASTSTFSKSKSVLLHEKEGIHLSKPLLVLKRKTNEKSFAIHCLSRLSLTLFKNNYCKELNSSCFQYRYLCYRIRDHPIAYTDKTLRTLVG
jgi:hypothetical protein